MREAEVVEKIACQLDTLVTGGCNALVGSAQRAAWSVTWVRCARLLWLSPVLAGVALHIGWITLGMAWLYAVVGALLVLLVVWATSIDTCRPSRCTVLAWYDRQMQSGDRLLTAEQFLQRGPCDGFQVAALLDAQPWIMRALAWPSMPKVASPEYARWTFCLPLLGVSMLTLFTLLTVNQLPAASSTTMRAGDVAPPIASSTKKSASATEAASLTQAAPGSSRTSTSAISTSSADVVAADVGRASAVAAVIHGISAVAASVSGGGTSSNLATADAGAVAAISTRSTSGTDAGFVGMPMTAARSNVQHGFQVASDEAGNDAAAGSEQANEHNAQATAASEEVVADGLSLRTQALASQQTSQRRQATPNNRSQRGDGKSGQSQGGSSQGNGQGQQGNGDEEGIKRSRGISGLMLGVPMEDRLRGIPNAGRIRQFNQPGGSASPTAGNAAQARGTGIGDSGELVHLATSASEQRLVRDYFLRQRQDAGSSLQGEQ